MSSDSEPDFDDSRFLQDHTEDQHDLSYAERRKKELRKQFDRARAGSKRSLAQREREARDEGLSTSILEREENSKAAKMMKKMGFKPGDALGKAKETAQTPEVKSGPSKEPLNIRMRPGRLGVGHAKADAVHGGSETTSRTSSDSQAKTADISEFRDRARDTKENQRASRLLKAARRTCRDLDLRAGLEESIMWLDPEDAYQSEGHLDAVYSATVVPLDDDDEETPSTNSPLSSRQSWFETEPSARLAIILNYLRDKYAYCFWCGCQYKDSEDLGANCPGEEEESH